MRISDWSSDVCSSDLHFSEGILKAFGLKYRVISETSFSCLFAADDSIDDAFKKMFISAHDQGNHSPEPGGTVLFIFEFGKQFFNIGDIIAVFAGVARRMDSGDAAESFYIQSSCIGKEIRSETIIEIMACSMEEPTTEIKYI